MTVSKTFMLRLRCYDCGKEFHLHYVAFDNLSSLQLVTPCPRCGARPYIAPRQLHGSKSKLHTILDLRESESIFRKTRDGGTWHFSDQCSHWPSEDFIQLEALPIVGELCNECQTELSRRPYSSN